jgi:hypothetical protein
MTIVSSFKATAVPVGAADADGLVCCFKMNFLAVLHLQRKRKNKIWHDVIAGCAIFFYFPSLISHRQRFRDRKI